MIPNQQTPNDYYAYGTPNEGNYWGDYQFVTLKDVLDEVMVETTDSDSYLKNTRRSKLLVLARAGVRDLNQTIKKNIHAIEMEVDSSLSIPVPQDYVDWVRVSMVGDDNKLKPLNINNRIPTYIGYLQDNNNEILFDDEGYILQSDGVNAYGFPFSSYLVDKACCSPRDTSKLSLYGEVKIDNERGRLVMSSNMEGRLVVFEYVSDGLVGELHGETIKVHKHLLEPLKAYIYSRAISTKRNVPRNEKDRANEFYKGLRHKALVASQDFNIPEISRIMGRHQI